MKAIFLSILAQLIYVTLYAQESSDTGIEMADAMRSSGKIYVVVLVLSVILLGLFLYLINIDRKLGKFEKEIKSRIEK